MKTAALIVAGGRGARMQSEIPKQYLTVGGQAVLARTIRLFLGAPAIDRVQVVIGADDISLYEHATAALNTQNLSPPVVGGASRSASVCAGLNALAREQPDVVLIHDAARPFCSHQIIDNVLTELSEADGAFAALPVVDALWRGHGGMAKAPVSRDGLWRAQTPQGFHFAKILAAHNAATEEAVDDVAIARAVGLTVKIVQGEEANFKITTPSDLARAERLLKERPHDAP